ncbi:glycosyltransferase family 2 protein [Candidatus Magnetominusculus xianensis]|uniref:Glycosyl transferase n=1 Tax=Candidatus Magnetominusculus xianensis TaxID=1748249 RepID=A0ABR5SCZ4_9BACT|nr:glycosyltransferase family 2 protein [Candidatus Magnetominusculus xianensis]KWT82527.1 putative glycosyl transferase [Candidatus Magnetominusculus xianensis]MBF0405522.1 glycosyltransferase family 2 protein [Nitrospirota bacterium]
MLLTVAIPNYNGAAYIRDTIISCRNISLPHDAFEILIVDNASTDNSVKIAGELTALFPNIRIIENSVNIGRLPNWKKCISEARGTYLNFLFVTNEFHKDNDIHELARIMERDDSISMSVSPFFIETSQGQSALINVFEGRSVKKEGIKFIQDRLLHDGELICGYLQANLMRVIDLIDIQLNEALPYCADQIFAGQALLKRKYVYFSTRPRVVLGIYKNPQRFTANSKAEDIMKNFLSAAHILTRMVDIKPSKLTRFYGEQLRILFIMKFFNSHNFSMKSNYLKSLIYVLESARDEGIRIADIVAHFIIKAAMNKLKPFIKLMRRLLY